MSLILPKGSIPFIESAFPLACVDAEDRCFTYAISMRLSTLLSSSPDIEELEIGADAIDIVVDDLAMQDTDGRPPAHSQLSSHCASEIIRVMGQIRRSTVIPVVYHVVFPENGVTDHFWRRQYLSYVYHGLRLAPEYISVDLRLDNVIPSQPKGPPE
jgi:hypothetical protein